MKKSILTLALGAFAAISATAAPIGLTSIGIGGASEVTLNSVSNPTSLTFANLGGAGNIFSLGCSGVSAASCNPVGSAVTISSLVWTNVSAETFTFASGLIYQTTGFTINTNTLPGGGLVINTVGNYSTATDGPTAGTLNFSFQFPTDGTNAPLGKYNFSSSGSTAPEPGSMALLGSGLLGLGLAARRRLKK